MKNEIESNEEMNDLLWDSLFEHKGHRVEIVTYGNPPVDVCLECLDCNAIILDAEIYTLQGRSDLN